MNLVNETELPEIQIVEKAIICLQTKMEMLAVKIWMDGNQKEKAAGVILNIPLKHAKV